MTFLNGSGCRYTSLVSPNTAFLAWSVSRDNRERRKHKYSSNTSRLCAARTHRARMMLLVLDLLDCEDEMLCVRIKAFSAASFSSAALTAWSFLQVFCGSFGELFCGQCGLSATRCWRLKSRQSYEARSAESRLCRSISITLQEPECFYRCNFTCLR